MKGSLVDAPAGAVAPDLAGLEPLETIKSRWPMVFGGLVTMAMIIGLARELLGSGLKGLQHAVPTSPLFYVAFIALYISAPLGDFIIFRRLWRIPLEGLAALMKKRIANDVVLGYSGDAYFYAWARQRASMIAAPFGAVKDVAILSAMAGNFITLVSIAAAAPFAVAALSQGQIRDIGVSAVIVVLMSLPFLILSKRVFSLPRYTLWWIFAVHCTRLLAGSLAIALAWHFGMPGVSLGTWLVLSAARMLVGRLPLVPNKDLLFANFAILLIGEGTALSSLVAIVSALTLLVHVALICVFSVDALVRKRI